jgi:SAM-dependent MidA family methyltransferase
MPSALPVPDRAAVEHSTRVAEHIRAEIQASGGWISFARFMELALYAPALGYYFAGTRKLGSGGDFVTAPEISPLFGRMLARQVGQVVELGGEVLELGAGSGKLAVDLLTELERLDRVPRRYRILEVSSELAQRQYASIQQQAPGVLPHVEWLATIPEKFSGMVLANEVLDAVPANVVAWRDDGVHERGVCIDGEGFAWQERRANAQLREAAERIDVSPPYLSEISLLARALVFTLAQHLQRGVLLFIDYGFGRREYYHPQRNAGTLMCHFRHRAHDDPFFLPGLQDITAHVDFTAVAEAAARAGAGLLGYTTQAQFLLNCGITDELARTPADDPVVYLPQVAAAQKLISPSEMGELFKVVALGKGIDMPLLGFSSGDKSRLL